MWLASAQLLHPFVPPQLTWRSFICSVVEATALSFFTHFIPQMHEEGFVLGLDGPPRGSAPSIDSLAFLYICMLSVAGGILGGVYNNLLVRINRMRQARIAGPRGRIAEVVVLSSLTSTLDFWLPVALGCEPCPPPTDGVACRSRDAHGGRHASIWLVRLHCPERYYSPMATLMQSGQEGVIKHLLSRYPLSAPPYPPHALAIMLGVYYLLAVVSMGIAVPAGNFVPGLVIGGLTGRLFGETLAASGAPSASAAGFPGMMALVGATAVLGGMTRMTLTIAAVLTEITDDVHILPTIMLALAIAKAVGDRLSPSFDDAVIQLMNLPMLEGSPPTVLEPLVARDVMARPVITLKEQLMVGDLVQILSSNNHNGFPVVSGAPPGFVPI
jgi:chloride channel 7